MASPWPKLSNLATNGHMEKQAQLNIITRPEDSTKKDSSLLWPRKTLFFTIGLKYLSFTVMAANTQAAEINLFCTKKVSCISEDTIILWNSSTI